MLFHEPVQRDGGLWRRDPIRRSRILGATSKRVVEFGDLGVDSSASVTLAQGPDLTHLQQLEVVAEGGGVLGHVAVDVEHAAVVVAEHAEPVVAHAGAGDGGIDPGAGSPPRLRRHPRGGR